MQRLLLPGAVVLLLAAQGFALEGAAGARVYSAEDYAAFALGALLVLLGVLVVLEYLYAEGSHR
ncbi:MAG: hypothetical protein GXO66_01260 [Euryarchaeota archaeon]|nr:hypothetical protein [Euryarchaeota archaeon]